VGCRQRSRSSVTACRWRCDHLGTPQRITDANQNIVWDAALRPFGEVEQMTQTFTLNLRFPGIAARERSERWMTEVRPSTSSG
jgi:uncharacterized protein RhaS with RHS repeats